ncbi:MAG: hypothetical protein ACI87E_003829 [Mariniblastus sp.]|jgi:uncharacterized protein
MTEATLEPATPLLPGHAPTSKVERIVSIDVLRGFALLGILMMNIQSFGLIDAKYLNPTAQGELSGLSYACWWFGYVFFDSKFMAIFSMLFGAGTILMWQRAKASGRKSTGLHYRRMGWLLLIGLAHAHLLWHGDILVLYAMTGMGVYWLCGLKPKWLISIGILLLAIGSGMSFMAGFSLPYMQEAEVADIVKGWSPTAEQISESLAINRGGWLEQLPHRSQTSFQMETFVFLFLFVWRISGLMLLGMALFKLNVLNGGRSNQFYVTGAGVGLTGGLALSIAGILQLESHQWAIEYAFFFGSQYNYWGSVLVCFAYICLVMLACKNGWADWLSKPLAAVGQMALTNYLSHTLICTTIFYGHGLGWFGYLDRIQLVGIVVAIWILQLLISPVWLKHFRFGPFEWIWRSLSYWKVQPLMRRDGN